MFPDAIRARASDCEYLYKRESAKIVGFEHGPVLKTPAPGEYVIDDLRDSRRLWRTVHVPDDAPTMRRALAFTTFPRHIREGCRRLRVGIAVLNMEEDEVTEDGGFPILIRDDDEAFVDRSASDMSVAVTLFPVKGILATPRPPDIPVGIAGVSMSASGSSSSSAVASSSSASESDTIVCAKKSSLSQGQVEVFLGCGDGLRPGSYQLHIAVLNNVISMTFFVHAKAKTEQ